MNLVGDEDSLQDFYNKKLAMSQFLPQRKVLLLVYATCTHDPADVLWL